MEQSSWVRIPHLAKSFNSGFWEILFPKSEDVRVVKETVSRSVVAKRKGSNPFPRIWSVCSRVSLHPLQVRPPQFMGFCASKKALNCYSSVVERSIQTNRYNVGSIPTGNGFSTVLAQQVEREAFKRSNPSVTFGNLR